MKQVFFIGLIFLFAVEVAAVIWFGSRNLENNQDALAVNEVVQSVQKNWFDMGNYVNESALDYAVLSSGGEVIYTTKSGLSENINSAIIHSDTILDIAVEGNVVGKVIIQNDIAQQMRTEENKIIAVFAASLVFQLAILICYTAYLNGRIIKPFRNLKSFAERVAGGNLDIPLEMDRGNLFGAFTESFDIMRSELKKARLAEAKANAAKKELVAKLSHDIRTPIASIIAVSELGAAVSESEKTRGYFSRIISKADQINTLVGNLFSATLEELQQLTVTPSDMSGAELNQMLEASDYFHKAKISEIPEYMIYADKLRLQQVFDNIFSNSYKYANTEISVNTYCKNRFLAVEIEDMGGGVAAEELPLLKEKFKRGSNAESVDGAGLGLYISNQFMAEMKGELLIENGKKGLKITVLILLSGNI